MAAATHGAAAAAEMAGMERRSMTPAQAWEHAQALYRRGQISKDDLERVRQQLSGKQAGHGRKSIREILRA